MQIRDGGALYVRGAAAQPVRFTSQATSPTPGSWLGIEVWQAGARLDAEHLDLAYAGREDTQSLLVMSSDVSIRDSRIHHGLASGITMVGDDLTPAFQRLEIDHVTGAAVFQDRLNQSPIFEDIWAHDNGFDGLAIYNFGSVLTWAKTLDVSGFRGEPIVRLGRVFQISGPAASLEIPPGLTLEFDWGAIYVMNGARLDARGTVTQPITFTSAHADKQPGQWDGITIFSPESVTSPVYLEYCDIGYAGGNNHASVWIQGAGNAHVEINHCQIHDSSAMGIAIQDGGPNNFVRIAHTAIVDTAENGIDIDWAYPPLLAVNTLERNGLYAIHYQRGVYPPLEAYYHYWGHPSGPYHPSLNPTGVGGRVSDGVLFDPWSDGRTNVSVAPEALSPAPNEVLTTLPIRFRMVSHDPDDWQKLYYQVEILQGGVRQALYDQRVSTDGWDRAFYAPGITATLTLRNILPNGAYTWRVAVFDGHEEVWSSEERPFTVALGVAFAVTGLTPEEVLGRPNVTQTLTLHGLGFVNGLAQVRVERRLWDDAVQTLTPINVQVVSPTQITFGLNLTGASGPWEVIVTQGASEARTPLFIYPYMPVFSYRYASPEILAADRLQEHTVDLTNWGSADGVAIVGIYSPKDAQLTVPAQAGVEYLGNPFARMHLLAVQVNANVGRDVRLQWKMPWSAINPPGQPPDPALYDQGSPLRFKFAVVGQLSTQAWNALKAEAPGDIQQQVYLAAWGGALAEGFAADAYLDAADRTLAHDYIERLGAVYPSIADALVLRQYDDFMLALYDAIDYPLPEVSGAATQAGIQNGVFRSWLERAVGDPWEFTKTFFTGFDDVISSGQAGAFFVAEMEGLVEGLTFGLFRPSFGAKTMAHVAGLEPGAIGIGRFIGNMLSIPLGPGSGKLAGKGVGNVLRGAHTALKPTEDVYLAWNKLKLTIAGNAGEPQRWGLSVISKNRDLPLIHWGNNPRYGGFHWALGWEGKRVPGNLTGGLGEELYGAGLHFYENHMYVPDAFLQGVPFLHVIEDKALRQYFNVIKEATFADIRLMNADIGDHLYPPAVPPQDDALCNQGAQTLRFAWDPNAIEGTPRASHILPSQEIGLLIRFENLISATLPAEGIAVTLPIHPNLDWDSIRLGDASHAFTVQTNPVERTLTWRFDDINLPPNANPPAGEGWIRLSVFPSATLTTGQQIAETAMIVFDTNPPMWTNVITYTIDLAPPSVELAVAEGGEPGARAVITATDNSGGSGVALVGLEYSADGANWVQGPYLTAITPTAAITGVISFGSIPGGHYWLRAFARDAIGNTGPFTDPVEADVPRGLYLYLPLVLRGG